MAERRMISKCISISEKVNSLPDVFDMLLYTWLIPHTDDFGRMPGSPAKVKALVVPMMDKTMKEVESSLSHLHDFGLIQWYEVDGTKHIQVENFDEHQTGLHKRTKSKFPDPPGTEQKIEEIPDDSKEEKEIPGTSGKIQEIPSELKRTEQKRTKKNLSSDDDDPNASDLIEHYHDEFLKRFGAKPLIIGGKHGKLLKDLMKTYPYEDLKKYIVMYLDDKEDKYITESGYSIEMFKTKIQKYVLKAKDRKPKVEIDHWAEFDRVMGHTGG